METVKPGMLYIAADGDGIGKLVGRAVMANDVDELHAVSNRIDAAQDYILDWCDRVKGIKISGGGDEFTAAIPPEARDSLKDLRKSIEKAFGYTISIGVGRSLSEAGTALLVAKLRGKDRIVWFNKKIKEDIKKAKRRVREGRASQEEYKLSEAYLKKADDMFCDLHKKEQHKAHIHALHKHEEGFHNSAASKEDKLSFNPDKEDNRTDDCSYCQDLDAEENADGTAGMHDCDMCKEYDASKQNTGGIETDDCSMCQEYDSLHGNDADDCPMCQEYNAAQGTKDLENITEDQAHPETDQTNLAVEDQAAQRPEECPDCQKMFSDAVENEPSQTAQEDPNLQGHETAEEVLDLLDQEPGAGAETPAQEAKKIDNTELPQGDAMKDNVSVTEDFGPAQKADVSESEAQLGQKQATEQQSGQESGQEEPDMSDVLQSGLDEHADEQRKQEVLSMVAQTLQGFKANKASLEASKEQNQGLYNSCIQMLKSMIELCKLLGLEPKMPTSQESSAPTQEAPQAGPQAPAQDAAPSEVAAQDPKAQAG